MAAGDDSTGDLVRVVTPDTVEIAFTSGPRAGSTWICRARRADAYEQFGPNKFAGQGALAAVQQWAADSGNVLNVLEEGLDQWGRIIGAIQGDPFTPELSQFLLDGGWANDLTETFTSDPDIRIFVRSAPRVGGLSDADLIADRTQP